MTEDAYADLEPEIRAKAIEGAKIWKILEKEERAVDEDKIDRLAKDFKKIRFELNKEGIATAKQYKDNPDYWRSSSHPEFPEAVSHKVHRTYDSQTTASSDTCSSCSQKGYFISGFDWRMVPSIWKTSESAVVGQGWHSQLGQVFLRLGQGNISQK